MTFRPIQIVSYQNIHLFKIQNTRKVNKLTESFLLKISNGNYLMSNDSRHFFLMRICEFVCTRFRLIKNYYLYTTQYVLVSMYMYIYMLVRAEVVVSFPLFNL
jgi:hypothetical protein